jgi:hypothetical protein
VSNFAVIAIVTAHNIIVIHYQLKRSPDGVLFSSPIPLQTAAMTILCGSMSRIDRLSQQQITEDIVICLAVLETWDVQGLAGASALITRLAEEILKINIRGAPPPGLPTLISESDWGTEGYFPSAYIPPSFEY